MYSESFWTQSSLAFQPRAPLLLMLTSANSFSLPPTSKSLWADASFFHIMHSPRKQCCLKLRPTSVLLKGVQANYIRMSHERSPAKIYKMHVLVSNGPWVHVSSSCWLPLSKMCWWLHLKFTSTSTISCNLPVENFPFPWCITRGEELICYKQKSPQPLLRYHFYQQENVCFILFHC